MTDLDPEPRLIGRSAILVLSLALAHATACNEPPTSLTPDQRIVHLPLGTAGAERQSVKIGRESRLVVPVTSGQRFEEDFIVPRGGRLELAGGATCSRAEGESTPANHRPCTGTAQFTVRGTLAANGQQLFARSFRVPVPSPTWRSEIVELDTWSGRHVELEFVAVVEDGGPEEDAETSTSRSGSRASLWWSEPLILHSPEEAPPNVIFISIDTLRADRLGAYGHYRDTSPTLDALAAEGVRFDQAFSHAPWTTPSHMSLMTSMYPSTHGINPSFPRFLDAQRGRASYPTLSDDIRPLATLLRDRGYITLGVTGGGTVGAELGFSRGFDRYYDDGETPPSPDLESHLLSWLRKYGSSPFFLFFHTFEVHAPYTRLEFAGEVLTAEQLEEMEAFWSDPHERTVAEARSHLLERGLHRAEITSALYDGGIREADRTVSELLEALRRLGAYDNTLIVVTSDHGEEFGEHNPRRVYSAHCTTLYDELIRVPLIIKTPGSRGSGATVDDPVELVDVAPTVLDLIGIEIPQEMQGSSLRRHITGSPASGPEPAPAGHGDREPPDTLLTATVLSESTCNKPEWKSLRTRRFKYIATFDLAGTSRSGIPGEMLGEQFFDLRADPGEQNDLAASAPPYLATLRDRLMQRLAENARTGAAFATGSTELSEEMRQRLRALGYLR